MPKSQGNKSNETGYKKKLTRQEKIMIGAIVSAVTVVATLVVVIVVLLNREPPVVVHELIHELPPALGPPVVHQDRSPGGRGFIVTEDNVEEVREAMEQRRLEPEDYHFTFSLTPTWTFPTATSPSPDARVQNLEINSRTVFFDVYIEGIGVVYISPYMPLGSEHRGFALDFELETGEYSAVVTYFLVDDDLQVLTDISVGVTIVVES